MAANNVKTAFSLPSGVNEDFIKDLMQHHHQQSKNIIQQQQQQQQQNINQFTSEGVSKYTQEKTCAGVHF